RRGVIVVPDATATSVEVGTAYVAIIPSAKGFVRNLQKAIAKEVADSSLDKMIAEQLGDTRVRLPVEPVLAKDAIDTSGLRRPVTLPVQAEVDRRETAREVRQAVQAAERTAPTVTLDVDVDRDRLQSMLGRAVDGATAVLSGLAADAARSLSQLTSGFATNMASAVSTVATTGTATTAATGGLNLLAGALIAAAGAAAAAATGFVALAPVVLVAGGAIGAVATSITGLTGVVATLKLGLGGLGDALQAHATGDAEAFAEAMANLSANGRSLVRTLIDLKPRFDELRRTVQDRLLAGFGDAVRDLA